MAFWSRYTRDSYRVNTQNEILRAINYLVKVSVSTSVGYLVRLSVTKFRIRSISKIRVNIIRKFRT